ncbi:hypothetical protein PaG_01203 [Moesziomyces aphidis]|uniref:Uncharacterized protein n=1 Tax=Moesziomyces aphidis TaxID=84754 RepID=W3VS37_MOEAP|nr:hypothetical protein PaG_01203 [Moesziomyces aphidis]
MQCASTHEDQRALAFPPTSAAGAPGIHTRDQPSGAVSRPVSGVRQAKASSAPVFGLPSKAASGHQRATQAPPASVSISEPEQRQHSHGRLGAWPPFPPYKATILRGATRLGSERELGAGRW